MSITYTYTSLTSALRNFTEDQGSEFLAIIPSLIALGETRLLRDLDVELFDQEFSGTFDIGNRFITKPANIVQVRSLYYVDTAGNHKYLDEKSFEYLREYWPNSATLTATPRYFCEYSDTLWMVAGTPSADLSWTARCIVRPPGLSDTVPTTWLSTRCADALLYACLISGEQFLKADNRVPLWGVEYTRALAAARAELKNMARDEYNPVKTTPVKEE